MFTAADLTILGECIKTSLKFRESERGAGGDGDGGAPCMH